MNRTYSPKASEIDRAWHVVDAAGVPLGRLSSTVARLLMGKHKPTYARHLDTGDFVVVINAKKTLLTGRKEEQKVYYSHTGRPGSLRSETAAERRTKHPRRLIEGAVKGMLPKTKLGRAQFKKLKVYGGAEHNHEAQQPVPFDVAAAL